MAWAKLHTDILGDPKLMRAARKGAKHVVLLPWLLAFAKQADDDGRLTVAGEPADADDIAPLIPGASAAHVTACQSALLEIGVLVEEDGVLRFAQWAARNDRPASDSTERVRERVQRFRQRRRANTKREGTEEMKRGETGNVTALQVTGGNDIEEEGEGEVETETETEHPPPPRAREVLGATAALPGRSRDLLGELAASLPNASPYLAEVDAALDGMHGFTATPEQVRIGVTDWLANGEAKAPNLRRFRNYLRGAKPPPHAGRRTGAHEDLGEIVRREAEKLEREQQAKHAHRHGGTREHAAR